MTTQEEAARVLALALAKAHTDDALRMLSLDRPALAKIEMEAALLIIEPLLPNPFRFPHPDEVQPEAVEAEEAPAGGAA